MINVFGKAMKTSALQVPFEHTASSAAAISSTNITALQQNTAKLLAENLDDLQNFATKEIPAMITAHEHTLTGIEQLAANVRAMMK